MKQYHAIYKRETIDELVEANYENNIHYKMFILWLSLNIVTCINSKSFEDREKSFS